MSDRRHHSRAAGTSTDFPGPTDPAAIGRPGRIGIQIGARIFLGVALGILLIAAGCATAPLPRHGGELRQCTDFFRDLDRQTRAAQALDGGPFRVPGFPYLRVDRFLASFSREIDTPGAYSRWISRMQSLDREARRHEIANLPAGVDREDLNHRVATCGNRLKQADMENPDRRRELADKVAVPDEYSGVRRWAGLYPLTRWFVKRGVAEWQTEARAAFSLEPPASKTPDHDLKRYFPQAVSGGPSIAEILSRSERDELGIPRLARQDSKALLAFYAPVWEVETRNDADHIGSPFRNDRDEIGVDIRRPRTYTLLAYTRFNQKILIQLNYVVWFPARPKTNALDIYGGRLDGVTYRVTLDPAGEPLLHETMHNCGCFYKAYPTSLLKIRQTMAFAEPPLILAAPELNPGRERLVISMTARTHYVEHLYALPRQGAGSTDSAYTFGAYTQLRSLPYQGRSGRSMFDSGGIAHGSDRLERFILWPMGVVSPGAMRQWGRHPISLIGKRHFDDPFDMARMFVPAASRP